MIAGVGTDIVEIARVTRACERKSFLEKVYTEAERELIAADSRKAAGNFAVKEAVSKVFGTGFSRIRPCEIEVLRNSEGAPYVNLYGEAKRMAVRLGIGRIFVSISNTDRIASAFAVGESADECANRREDGKDSKCGANEGH